jgi:hypothetical protein
MVPMEVREPVMIMRPAPFVGLLSRTSLPKLTVPGYAGRLLPDQLEVGSNQLPLEAPVYVLLAALAAAAPRRARRSRRRESACDSWCDWVLKN